MKQLEKFKQLDKKQKVEFIIASVISASLLITVPVYAWFASNRNLETITKIKEPGEIIIRAGKSTSSDVTDADPIVNFEMNDIDIEKIASGKPQRFVFSVYPGDYNLDYKLQIAHTTNNPFTYDIYKAEAVANADELSDEAKAAFAPYHTISDPTSIFYYRKIGTALPMNTLNESNDTSFGRIAKQNNNDDPYKCFEQSYGEIDNENPKPDIYAVPIYMQTADTLSHSSEVQKYDYYILELGWEQAADGASAGYKAWNTATNNKETDIIYITAKRSTG